MVQKVISEQNNKKEQLHENGTFELHYTPANTFDKSFVIPIPVPRDHQQNKQAEDNPQKYWGQAKDDQNQSSTNSNETIESRH
jgi:hypothetical protein